MTWSKRFEEPVQLPDGSQLFTLHQAAKHILTLSNVDHRANEWRSAMRKIIEAADHGGSICLARAELLLAIQLNCSGRTVGPENMNKAIIS